MSTVEVSQNGWPTVTSSAKLAVFPWITGRVLPGDVYTIFDYLCARFNVEVEPIIPSSSWGWNYRPIAGSSTLSNHASGTAIDVNAPQHPQGKADTFRAGQVKVIESILADLDGVIRWGGHYKNTVDDMHFEVNVPPTDKRVKALADKIRALTAPPVEPVPPVVVTPDPPPVVVVPAPLTDEDVQRIALAVAQFPIHYSDGPVIWLQDQANQKYRIDAIDIKIAALQTSLPDVVQQAVLAALAVAPITTTTTIGGKQ